MRSRGNRKPDDLRLWVDMVKSLAFILLNGEIIGGFELRNGIISLVFFQNNPGCCVEKK